MPNLSIQDRVDIAYQVIDILQDPDFGLELTERTKKILAKSLKSKRRRIPFSEIKKRFY